MKGFDSATPISAAKAKELYANGYDFICRYFSHNPEKNLTRPEAQDISDAGLSIVSAWEAQGDQYASFNTVMGLADAVAAKNQAQACGQPAGSAIYFAVDFDATQAEIDGGISGYFGEAELTLGPAYMVGDYGSPLVNASLASKGLAARAWRAQSTGWAGDHSQPADIIQGPEQTLLGIDVDTDTTSETAARIGAWQLVPTAPIQPPSPQPHPQLGVLDAVKELQIALGAQGFDCGAIDGMPGPQTQAALSAYWQSIIA